MTVGELCRRTTSRELTEWMAYERLEPFGERVIQMMLAQLTATVISLANGKKGKPVKAEDLMPRFVDEEDKVVDWRVLMQRMKTLTAAAKETNHVRKSRDA